MTMATSPNDQSPPVRSKPMIFVVDSDVFPPQDYSINETLPGTLDCPIYGLVLCCWNNILGPHAKRLWLTEGKKNFTPEHVSYLSTHTLTSCEQPQSTIDTKILILSDRGIVVTVFLFCGHDRDEKTIFALSLVVPYKEYSWYLPLHELCASRLTGMIRKLQVLQHKTKDEHNDSALEAFSSEVPSFINVVTLLKTHGLPSNVELRETVFASGQVRQLDSQFTRSAIASHLQTFGCSIVLGNTPADVNLMINTLALFLSPAERRCCLYLDDIPRNYEKDILIQGFIKDSINLDDYLWLVMKNQYPTTLIDMVTLDVRQTLYFNEHAFRCHEYVRKELQSLWLDSKEPLHCCPVVHFANKPEMETMVHGFLQEIFLLPAHSGTRETYTDEFLRVLDRKAVSLIKYVEEETNRGNKPNRLSLRRLKTDLHLLPEGNFRIVLAVAEKLLPGIYTLVCGNPALPRDYYNELVGQ